MENLTVSERFGLKENNFLINPRTESQFFTERQQVDLKSISKNLLRDIVTEMAPKRLVWGAYGSGKTHTLYALANILGKLSKQQNSDESSILVIYMEAKILKRNASFLDVYNDIMNKIGKQRIESLFSEVYSVLVAKYEPLQRDSKKFREYIEKDMPRLIPDLYEAIAAANTYNPPMNELWRWLTGEPISSKILDNLNIECDLAKDDPPKLVEMLISIAKLLEKYHGQQLMILLDELDRWDNLSNEANSSIEMGFLNLCDQKQQNISVILSVSVAGLVEKSTLFFLTDPVLQRIGTHNKINIPILTQDEAHDLILKVIAYRRKDDLDNRLSKIKSSEKITKKTYPFSEEAIEQIISIQQMTLVPRSILQAMTIAAGQAHIENSNIITSDFVESGVNF